MLRPLGDRVLIKPEPPPDQTESGLWLMDQKKPDQVGTVVAVGRPVHPLRLEAETLAEKLILASDGQSDDLRLEAAHLLGDLTRRVPAVHPGDFVVFSWQAGQEVQVDAETYLLLREDELLAVLDEGVTVG